MPKLWLPSKTIEISYGGRTRIIVIPSTGDPIWDRDLEQSAREKTLEELKKMPPREKPKHSKLEIAEALNDLLKFRKRNEKRFY